MTKPLKIIHLSGFNLNKDNFHPKKDSDYYFVASWAGLIARRLKKRFPDLDVEVWRAEPEFNKTVEKKIFGINCIIFPYKKPLIPKILTLEMYKRLLRCQEQSSLIIHNHGLNTMFLYFAPFVFGKSVIIAQDHGGVFPLEKSLKHSIKRFLIKRSFKKLSAITYLRKKKRDYLETIPGHPKLHFLTVGADFNNFYPMDKNKCRDELGLERERVYAIYVGRFYKLKSVDLILDVYKRLGEKYNFSIIFVGGKKHMFDDLYDEIEKSGCPYYGVQPWDRMKTFYNAADFYIHPTFNPEFGGLDVSWMEALACNRPVISACLEDLDFDYSKLGTSIDNIDEIESKVDWMINHYSDFTSCREAAGQHLDGNSAVMNKIMAIYKECLKKRTEFVSLTKNKIFTHNSIDRKEV